MKTRIALVFCVCAAMSAVRANGFDWPPAGGTATIPAGETVEVAGNGVTAAAACGAIVIEQGATLKFTGITANATFAGSISGSGTFSAENASTSTYRLTFTGDLSSFTGSFDFKYVYATFNTSASGSAPIRMLQANTAGFYSQFAGGYTYNNPLDATVGANYGLRVLAGSELGGGIAWRGSGRLHGGRITGPFTLYGTCYAVDGVAFEGGVLPGGTGGKYLEADNGTMHLKSPVGAISRLCVINGDGKAIFYGENLLDDSITLAIGKTWGASHRCGTYDLNGYSQRAKSLSLADQEYMIASSTIVKSADPATLTLLNQDANVNYRGQLKGAVSLDLSSASGKTLALSGTANDTTGSLAVRSGTLALAAGARFPNVSSLVATNAGTLSVSTENVNPAVELALFGSGKINVDAGVTFFVCRATLDGAYLPGGEYTKDSPALQGRFSGDGTLVVVNGAPAAAGDTYVWTGAAGDGLLTTDGNWEDGAAPDLTAGTAKLVFSAGTPSAAVSGAANVYGITFCADAAFTLTSAGANAKVVLGAGGLVASNTAAASVTHVLDVPVEMGELPQTWQIATNTSLSLAAPLSGRASHQPLTIRCFGRPEFRADNSGLLTDLVLTNATTATQPHVYHMKGLGAPGRYTTVWGAQPRFITDAPQGGSLTNETPLRLRSGLTNQEGAYINSSGNAHLYLAGPVSFIGPGQSETYFHGNVHFTGGITNENDQAVSFRIAGGNEWIEDEPIRVTSTFGFDYPNEFNLAATNNYWGQLHLLKTRFRCHRENVLAVGRPILFGLVNTVYYSTPMATIDLNGFGQSVSRIHPAWTGYETVGNHNWASTYGLVRSATPATMEITGAEDTIFPLKFEGAAGLHFNGTGSLVFTNKLSTTTGDLKVSRGTVRFARDSGWTAVTNIVLAGGTLAVDAGAGATAFGPEQGKSDALLTVFETNAPTLSVAAGEQATVNILAIVDEGGRIREKNPGVYGGRDAGRPAQYTLSWMSGAGTLFVRRSAQNGTMLILR